MASPHVAGVVGLMLAESPRLTAAQICGIIQRTSQPLPGRNYAWTDDGGYGVLDAELCVGEAKGLSNRVKLNP
jgi:subtilisin family serine protease